MQVTFHTRQLERAFFRPTEAVRLWGPEVGPRYIDCINYLTEAPTVRDLYQIRRLRFHPLLHGPMRGKFSATIARRWRLILVVENDTSITVEEVSAHYDD